MLIDEFETADERDPEELAAAYRVVLAETIDDVGVDAVVAGTDVEESTVTAIGAGEAPEISLETAAEILATDPDRRDADAIEADALDLLLMEMSTAVLDVEAIQSGIDGRMEAKEIQQKIEGRYPITLTEYAVLHQFIESKKP